MWTIEVDDKLVSLDESDIIDYLCWNGKTEHRGRKLSDDYSLALEDLFEIYDMHKFCEYLVANDEYLVDWAREHKLEDYD